MDTAIATPKIQHIRNQCPELTRLLNQHTREKIRIGFLVATVPWANAFGNLQPMASEKGKVDHDSSTKMWHSLSPVQVALKLAKLEQNQQLQKVKAEIREDIDEVKIDINKMKMGIEETKNEFKELRQDFVRFVEEIKALVSSKKVTAHTEHQNRQASKIDGQIHKKSYLKHLPKAKDASEKVKPKRSNSGWRW